MEPAARRPLVTAMICRKPGFPQRVCRVAHTHLVTTCRLPDQEITLSLPSAHLAALAMPRKQRPAATENGWPEPISGQNVELLGSLESPEDVDADRGQQR